MGSINMYIHYNVVYIHKKVVKFFNYKFCYCSFGCSLHGLSKVWDRVFWYR